MRSKTNAKSHGLESQRYYSLLRKGWDYVYDSQHRVQRRYNAVKLLQKYQ